MFAGYGAAVSTNAGKRDMGSKRPIVLLFKCGREFHAQGRQLVRGETVSP